MIRWLVSLLLTVGLGVAPTQGTRPGIMATYESGRGVERVLVGIWADDRGRVRAMIGAGHGGMEFLTRDNVGYAVVDDGPNGSVGRQEDMLALLATHRNAMMNRAMIERFARQRAQITRAGTERIAGFTGDVYHVTLFEGGVPSRSFEIVISADPRLAPVGRELRRFYVSLQAPIVAVAGTTPQPYFAIRELLNLGTPLRFGGMRLESLEDRPLTDQLTALPGPVLSREAFSAFLITGGMGADDPMAGEDGSYNGTYPADANVVEEAVNDTYPD
jgi:hypothetical protein